MPAPFCPAPRSVICRRACHLAQGNERGPATPIGVAPPKVPPPIAWAAAERPALCAQGDAAAACPLEGGVSCDLDTTAAGLIAAAEREIAVSEGIAPASSEAFAVLDESILSTRAKLLLPVVYRRYGAHLLDYATEKLSHAAYDADCHDPQDCVDELINVRIHGQLFRRDTALDERFPFFLPNLLRYAHWTVRTRDNLRRQREKHYESDAPEREYPGQEENWRDWALPDPDRPPGPGEETGGFQERQGVMSRQLRTVLWMVAKVQAEAGPPALRRAETRLMICRGRVLCRYRPYFSWDAVRDPQQFLQQARAMLQRHWQQLCPEGPKEDRGMEHDDEEVAAFVNKHCGTTLSAHDVVNRIGQFFSLTLRHSTLTGQYHPKDLASAGAIWLGPYRTQDNL